MAFAVDYKETPIQHTKGNAIMANERKAFNFRTQSGQSALAARIASIKTKHIEEIIKNVFGTSINIMQRFNMPQKCEAAIYIVDNAPQTVLQSILAKDLARYEADVKNTSQGRPVHLYRHDADHDNRSFNRNDIDESATQKIQVDDVAKIINDANAPMKVVGPQKFINEEPAKAIVKDEAKEVALVDDETEEKIETLNEVLREILAGKKAPSMDEGRVREIAREEDDTMRKQMVAAIETAIKHIHVPKPTIVHVAYEEKDKSVSVRDMGLQHKEFPMLLELMQVGFPVWIPGPAGSGKTTAVRHACVALGATLFMPPEGPVENKYGFIGYNDAMGKFNETSLYHACVYARDNPEKLAVFFIDECDGGYANALLVMNAVMENKYCTFANGERVEFGDNLLFIAGANTYGNGATHEYVGRNKLDAATLDRFITLAWDYDEVLETAIVAQKFPGQEEWVKRVQRIRKQVLDKGIKQVVSPRASLRGAALLQRGNPIERVLAMTVYKGMHKDQIDTISRSM